LASIFVGKQKGAMKFGEEIWIATKQLFLTMAQSHLKEKL